jgi:hypothetical protein
MYGRRIAQIVLSTCALILASAVLMGYFFGVPFLLEPVDAMSGRTASVVGMAPSTALSIACLALAMLLVSGKHK